MGYPSAPGDEWDRLLELVRDIVRRLSELERPDGNQTAEALQQIRDILDGIVGATNISVPGYVSAGTTVNAGGNVNAGGTLVSTYARTHSVVTSYVAAYIDGSGNFLATPSTRRMKRDIITATWTAEQRARIRVVYYRLRSAFILADMQGDGVEAETLVGVIGEELIEAGFPEFVVLDAKGRVFTVRYELLALIALDGLQQAEARIDQLEARLDAAGL